MKWLMFFLILPLLFSSRVYSAAFQPDSDLLYVFDLTSLPEITITFSEKEWNNLLSYYDRYHENEKCVEADFLFKKGTRHEELRKVGLRLRGNVFSRARPEGKNGEEHDSENPRWQAAHFRVVFDEYEKKQTFHRLKSLNLKWFNGDPAYVREIYCLDLFRRYGVYTASYSSYVRLTIKIKGDSKPAYFGIYRMVEPIDSVYVKRRFPGNDDGFLWKCLWPSDLTPDSLAGKAGIESFDPDNLHGTSKPAYDLKTRKKDFENKALPLLVDFAEKLSSTPDSGFMAWASNSLDVDLLLRAQAVNTAVAMWDDYWVNNNNYYLYQDSRGKVYFIPYDYDNTLGTAPNGNPGTHSALDWGTYWGGRERPLMDRVLSQKTYRDLYAWHLGQLIKEENSLFTFTASTNRILTWHNLIRPYIANDTRSQPRIRDVPASWGRSSYYRLLSGDDSGEEPEANFFKTRVRTIREELGLK